VRLFGAPLDLKFAKDYPIVSVYRVQGEEEPHVYLLILEPLRHELENL
jgi:hypothetical protein